MPVVQAAARDERLQTAVVNIVIAGQGSCEGCDGWIGVVLCRVHLVVRTIYIVIGIDIAKSPFEMVKGTACAEDFGWLEGNDVI